MSIAEARTLFERGDLVAARALLLRLRDETPGATLVHHALAFLEVSRDASQVFCETESKLYAVGRYHRLLLPVGHRLDFHQRTWKRYDRPLADICSAMLEADPDLRVIDIGANVADTAALLNGQTAVPVLCVEGNSKFLPYLRYNAERIGRHIAIDACFVGDGHVAVEEAKGRSPGTAEIRPSVDGTVTQRIEDILARHPDFRDAQLVKIDTDGFDFVILGTMAGWLEKVRPAVFFEFDPSFSPQGAAEGLRAIERLLAIGYRHFTVFDNFGNPMLEIDGHHLDVFAQLVNWLASHRSFGVTIYYLDVLALPANHVGSLPAMRRRWTPAAPGPARRLPRLDGLTSPAVLVIKGDGLGDLVMLSPFLRELRRALSSADITLAVHPRAVDLAAACPHVNRVLPIRALARGRPTVEALVEDAVALRAAAPRPFDVAIVSRWDVDYHGSSFLAGASLACHRLGYSMHCSPKKENLHKDHDSFYSATVVDKTNDHDVMKNLGLLRALGIEPADQRLESWHSSDDAARARTFLDSAGVKGPFIACGIGAGAPHRRLTATFWIDSLRALRSESDLPFVLFGGSEDSSLAAEIRGEVPAIDATGKLTLGATLATLERGRIAICLDSFVMHACAATGLPVIELSCHAKTADPGADNSALRFGPWGVPTALLNPDEPVPPCGTAGCHAQAPHCILGIRPEQVVTAFRTLLKPASLA